MLKPVGFYLIEAAETLILDVLAEHPGGLTNADVGRLTALNPAVRTQRGYITWTLLGHLIETGRVVREGNRYRLP